MPDTDDIFSQVTAMTSGPLAGYYLWSNAANWSLGVPPVDGNSVSTAVVDLDDFATLTVTSLTLSNGGWVYVTGASLDVTSVAGTSGTLLAADESDGGTPVTVTLATITGTGGEYGAYGAGPIFVDQSATDPGETYFAGYGGLTELSATPSSSSVLQYTGAGSTFALQNPGVANTFALENVAPNDVLELPGSSVSSVSFTPSTLSITTNDGSYAFLNVDYDGAPPTSYSAAFDSATGLEAITFLGLDTFSDVNAPASGPLAGDYLWSNAANWSVGAPPVDGDSVSATMKSYDDLAALSLVGVTVSAAESVYVTGASLAVTSVAGTSGTLLEADASLAGTPVTVTLGTITGTGGSYGATGAGAVFLDQSTLDPGENYFAQDGGFTELSATPSSSSTLSFAAGSTLALQNPGATNAFALKNVAPNDVLELPGSSVSNVSFGPGSSLSVTTNDGSYTFSNVTYYGNSAPTTYRAAFDATTGLEAITFLGLDTFVAINDLLGDTRLLWSNAANWSLGAPPIDGDSITFGNSFNISAASVTSYDDLAALTVASVILGFNDSVYVTGASLDVTSVAGGASVGLYADGNNLGTGVTVTVGTIIGNGDRYGASDPGASFVDQSAVDSGETYTASYGGRIELSATPNGISTLQYYGPASTFALQDPAATSAVALNNVGAGDVLELPGSSVSNVSFGTNSLTVTTNDGSYAFSNVTYNGPLASYTAAFDPTTGLEAITVFTLDAFSQVTPATSGPLDGDFLWSNGNNWSLGLLAVVDGESVSATGKSYDDLAAMTLASLTLSDGGLVNVTGASLDVTSLSGTPGTNLGADAFDVGTPVTVTVGMITGTGDTYGAAGTGAFFVDQSAVDPGESYFAELGGFTELSATPSSSSLLLYGGADSTFALQNPGATNSFALNNVVVRDVLELPGSSVSNVSFGSSSLSVTTNDGSYDFSNVTYKDGPPTTYSATFDSTTGLEAITFLGLDTFSRTTAATNSPLDNDYLWSNAANWSLGAPPVDGNSVNTTVQGYDDLAALTVPSLTLSDGGSVDVTGASLDVSSVAGGAGTDLAANAALFGTPVTVTVGTITGAGGAYGAIGTGAIFVDQSAADPGENYFADDGSRTEVSATPSSSSTLQYGGSADTFALQNPGTTNAFALNAVAPTDVLELPGSSVSNVGFGSNSLSITTNDGSYAFNNVTYAGAAITGCSAAFDPTTGLEAISFLGLDTFSQETAATSGPLDNDYLWSNADNWSLGVPPVDGDGISTAVHGYDDLAALTVPNLTLTDGALVYVTGASLDVTSVAGVAGTVLAATAALVGTPVTVTVGMITGTGGEYGAIGTGSTFVDQSAADPGESYFADDGGRTEVSATPSSSSTMQYGGAADTFALLNPGATNAFALNGVAPSDVLELPGSSVSNIGFGSSSLSITTNDGNHAFSNVTFTGAAITGYSAAFDPTTGLEAITFLGLDTFSQATAATSGPLADDYLWSNSDNWSLGVSPVDGDGISTAVKGYDDLAALTVPSLTLSEGGIVKVTGASLQVTSIAGTAGAGLVADAFEVGTPVTVTVGTIAETGGEYGADGAGAVFVDMSVVDPGETYLAELGGFTELSATPSSSSLLLYDGADSTFALQNPGATNAFAMSDATLKDVLELPGSSVSNVSFGPNSLSVTTNDGSYAFSNVAYQGGAITGFSAAFDATTGLEAITMLCFCAGSLIRTPSGEVLVEDLAIGDAVVTWCGEHRPITWIGIGQVLATRGHRNAATPVMVRKGALADNVPHADLRVTKGHSLFIDGALIPVELLVNHRSILWDDRAQEVSIYHIELASHDILIANSAPAESYRDDGNRWLFQNGNSAWDRMPQAPCVPVLAGGAVVDRVWRRLLDRSGPRPGLVLTDDADLHLLVDGQRLEHTRRDGSIYTFCLPEAALCEVVHIVSRAAAPDELGLARDPRVLGIALRNMIVLAGARHRIMQAADDRLVEGFHGHEPELDIRWTDGDASLPAALFDGFDGRVDLMLQVEGFTRYIASAEQAAIAA